MSQAQIPSEFKATGPSLISIITLTLVTQVETQGCKEPKNLPS